MAVINSEFEYNNPRPNFKRDQYKTLAEMKGVALTMVDRGHLSFCLENGKRYEFANDLDKNGTPIYNESTGYWREYSGVPTITMKESEWKEITDDPDRFAAFCKDHEGYILNITEDYIDIDFDNKFRFGDKFPIVFSNN